MPFQQKCNLQLNIEQRCENGLALVHVFILFKYYHGMDYPGPKHQADKHKCHQVTIQALDTIESQHFQCKHALEHLLIGTNQNRKSTMGTHHHDVVSVTQQYMEFRIH